MLGVIITGKWMILSICRDARWAADARGYGFDPIAMRETSRFSSSGRYRGSTSAGSSSSHGRARQALALEVRHGRKGKFAGGGGEPFTAQRPQAPRASPGSDDLPHRRDRPKA